MTFTQSRCFFKLGMRSESCKTLLSKSRKLWSYSSESTSSLKSMKAGFERFTSATLASSRTSSGVNGTSLLHSKNFMIMSLKLLLVMAWAFHWLLLGKCRSKCGRMSLFFSEGQSLRKEITEVRPATLGIKEPVFCMIAHCPRGCQ